MFRVLVEPVPSALLYSVPVTVVHCVTATSTVYFHISSIAGGFDPVRSTWVVAHLRHTALYQYDPQINSVFLSGICVSCLPYSFRSFIAVINFVEIEKVLISSCVSP